MNGKTEQGISSNTSLELVLSTWFIMYLHDDRPGGLPADFLSRGSSSLLVLDKVLCDKDALEAEKRSCTWLSSSLFLALEQEGILEPISMREHLSQEFFHHLRETGIAQAALKAMEAELALIKKGEKKPKDLQLPPFLTRLNHYMFMGLEIPSSLRYEWQESHFKIPPPSEVLPLQQPTLMVPDPEEKRRRQQLVVSVLKTMLPEFLLLPPLPARSEAAVALRKNIAREKPALYRWIYGDPEMPRDKYHDLRLGSDFSRLDKKVDGTRKAQAWQNFELLMKVRKATKDVRTGVQKIISDVVSGRRTIEDVSTELSEHQQELLSYLPGHRSIAMDVGLSTVGFAVAVAEILSTLSGFIPGVSPIGPGIAAYGMWQARAKRQRYRLLRQSCPLAWFLRDFKDIQAAYHTKLTPPRRRG